MPSRSDTHEVLYSIDYSGAGDPNLATWTILNSTTGWITTQVILYPSGNIRIQNMDNGPSIDLSHRRDRERHRRRRPPIP